MVENNAAKLNKHRTIVAGNNAGKLNKHRIIVAGNNTAKLNKTSTIVAGNNAAKLNNVIVAGNNAAMDKSYFCQFSVFKHNCYAPRSKKQLIYQ